MALIVSLFSLIATALDCVAAPNIVVIIADDMAYGDVSAYDAGAWVVTPNLDVLARSGIRFTSGYAAGAYCGPSRVGLLTGSYPGRSGVWANADIAKAALPPGERLMPGMLRDAGYTVAIVGKWNLRADPRKVADVVADPMHWNGGYWPEADGRYAGVNATGSGDRPSGLWGPTRAGDEYLTDRLTRQAVAFIEAQSRDRPFFLLLGYNAPHSPLEAHARHRARVSHLPTEPERLYAAMLLALDDGVGAVLAVLRAKGIDRETILAFVSDNGPRLASSPGYPPDWPVMLLGAPGPFSGRKGAFREAGIRVPFLVSWPGVVAPGQVRDDPVSAIDLLPTFAELAETVPGRAGELDGKSLVPLLTSPETTLPERDFFWAGRYCRDGVCRDSGAMRTGKWKLLVSEDGTRALYDLGRDPGERIDATTGHPDISGAMSSRYDAWKATLRERASANP